MEACKRMPPINDNGGGGTQITVYGGSSTTQGVHLYSPRRGPIVSTVPFTVCIETPVSIRAIQFKVGKHWIKVDPPSNVNSKTNTHTFHSVITIGDTDDLSVTFYEDKGVEFQGLFSVPIVSIQDLLAAVAIEGGTGGVPRQRRYSSKLLTPLDAIKRAVAYATTLAKTGELAPALKQLQLAIQLGGGAGVYKTKAKLHLQAQQYTLAIADAEMAAAIKPGDPSAWELLVQTKLELGAYDDVADIVARAGKACNVSDTAKLKKMLADSKQAQTVATRTATRWVQADERADNCPESAAVTGTTV
jgi:hypothetical protein